MKKLLFGLLSFLLMTTQIHAETDAKTIQFLEQLNLYYYCLNREGLKTYSFDVSLAFSKGFKKQMKPQHKEKKWFAALDKLSYSVSFPADGTKQITLIPPTSTGNAAIDADVKAIGEKFRDMVKNTLNTWSEFMVKPLHDQKNYSGDCKVQNTANGFTVSISDAEGNFTEIYDHQAKLLSASGTFQGIELSGQSFYAGTPKGFLLKQENLSFGGVKSNSNYEYVTVGKFLMPKKIVTVLKAPGVLDNGATITFNFRNYVINQ